MTFREVVFNSREIKKLIVQKSADFNIPLRYVCKEVGLNYKSFMESFINSSTGQECTMTEDDIFKVFGLLGLGVKYQITVNNEFNHQEVLNKLIEKFGDEQRNG